MYVCHCRAVTDTVVRSCVEAGACTLAELAERCGAGSRCGGCRVLLERLLSGLGDPSVVATLEAVPA